MAGWSFFFVGVASQAVLSFGPSAPLHPPHGAALVVSSFFMVDVVVARRYCPSDLPLRSIPHGAELVHPSFSWSTWWSQAVLFLGPSAPLHPPTPYGVGPARLRPRVARVLRTTLLATLYKSASSLSNCHALAAGHLRPRVTRTLRTIPLSTGRISARADSSRAVLNIHIQSLTIHIWPWPSSTLPAIPPRYVCVSNSSFFRHGTIYHRTL